MRAVNTFIFCRILQSNVNFDTVVGPICHENSLLEENLDVCK
jgi:hypothetical protein